MRTALILGLDSSISRNIRETFSRENIRNILRAGFFKEKIQEILRQGPESAPGSPEMHFYYFEKLLVQYFVFF